MNARILGLAVFAACLAVPAAAAVALSDAAGNYTISTAGSSIRFTIGKAGGGGFDGAFGRDNGVLRAAESRPLDAFSRSSAATVRSCD